MAQAKTQTQTQTTTVLVSGMHCAACTSRVRDSLNKVEGVDEAHINLATGEAVVAHVADVTEEALAGAVQRAGYQFEGVASSETDAQMEAVSRAYTRTLKFRTVFAAILSVPLVVGMLPTSFAPAAAIRHAMTFQFVLATSVLFGAGWPFLVGAVKAIRVRTADMNVLIASGTLSAYIYSAIVTFFPETFSGTGASVHGYFDAVGVIITLVLLGRYMEAKAKHSASSAIRELMDLAPPKARVLRNGVETEIDVVEVFESDVVIVKPGERFPVDGRITEGSTSIDESLLTGESMPVEKAPGHEVFAGTVNGDGRVAIEALRVGAATTLGQVVRLVREAQGSRAPVQNLVDRVVARFVPTVFVIALLAFFAWFFFGPDPAFTYGLVAAVTVVVIACPCAMGLATPTAIIVGTGTGAKSGILIRGGEALQRAKGVDTVVFDKTGTLTKGEPEVVDVVSFSDVDVSEVLSIAASAESGSEHPISRAILNRAEGYEAAIDIKAHRGLGVEGRLNGQRVAVGRVQLMVELGVFMDGAAANAVEKLVEGGNTTMVVSRGFEAIGAIAVADAVVPGVDKHIADLKNQGLKVVMLTGDNSRVAQAVATAVGIDDFRAELLPADKASAIEEMRAAGANVAMVGDGINDAPALAVANLGIAIGSGADVAKEASDITLVGSGIAGVGRALRLARKTHNTIIANLFWAFGYNVILIPVAAGVLYPFTGLVLNPAMAGVAMALSSVSVVANSLRLRSSI